MKSDETRVKNLHFHWYSHSEQRVKRLKKFSLLYSFHYTIIAMLLFCLCCHHQLYGESNKTLPTTAIRYQTYTPAAMCSLDGARHINHCYHAALAAERVLFLLHAIYPIYTLQKI